MGDSKERKATVKLNLNLSQFIAKLNSDLYIFAIGWSLLMIGMNFTEMMNNKEGSIACHREIKHSKWMN